MEVTFGTSNPPLVIAACASLCSLPESAVTLSAGPDPLAPPRHVDPATGDSLQGDVTVARYLLRLHPTAPVAQATFPHSDGGPAAAGSSAASTPPPAAASQPFSPGGSARPDVLGRFVLQAEVDQWCDFAHSRSHKSATLDEFRDTCAVLNAHLTTRTYLAGRALSLADVAMWGRVCAHAHFAHMTGPKSAKSFPHLVRWFHHVSAMPFADLATKRVAALSVIEAKAMASPPQDAAGLFRGMRETFASALGAAGGDAALVADLDITVPPPSKDGSTSDADYCFATFKLAKAARMPAPALAAKLAEHLTSQGPALSGGLVVRASSTAAFVNVVLNPHAVAAAGVGEHLRDGSEDRARAARLAENPAKRVVVEFSSPNTNKPQHLGHLRNNLIGLATSNAFSWRGDDVTKVNLINDRGVHICKSMLAWRHFGDGVTPESSGTKGDHLVGRFYVEFETRFRAEYAAWLDSPAAKEVEAGFWKTPAGAKAMEKIRSAKAKAAKIKDEAAKAAALAPLDDLWAQFKSVYKDQFFNEHSALGRETKDMLLAWEASDKDVRDLWTMMNGWVFAGFDATYARLGVKFDRVDRESQTYVLGKEHVQEGLASGIFYKEPNGAVACDLAGLGLKGMARKIVLRSDGTSVYMTQDLGTAIQRIEQLKPDKLVYVVACEQDDHFKSLFAMLGALRPRYDKDSLHHLSYGMVNLPTGRMKSREGTVVDLDDLADEVVSMAGQELLKRTPDLSSDEVARRAEAIGMAALKFFLLAFSSQATIAFDPSRSLDFTGKTGPYCLYSYARIKSMLRKVGVEKVDYDIDALAQLSSDLERAVAVALVNFRSALNAATVGYEPSRVADAVYLVAKSFNSMYTSDDHPLVSCPDPKLRAARFQLACAVASAIKEGLKILSIDVLEEM
jgi:arginyl-tRNA synthetase